MAQTIFDQGKMVGQSVSINGKSIGGSPNLYTNTTTAFPEYPVGTRLVALDGSVYRYTYFSQICTAGSVISRDVSETDLLAPIDTALTAAAIGATSIVLTSASLYSGAAVADQYAGGWLILEAGAGNGYKYRIKSHTAAAANVVTFTLFDPLIVAVTTATNVLIMGFPWQTCRMATTTDNLPCGVSLAATAAASYGWVQTWGPAVCLLDETAGTAAAGSWATLSDSVEGAVNPAAGSDTSVADLKTDPFIGILQSTGEDTEYTGIHLMLYP